MKLLAVSVAAIGTGIVAGSLLTPARVGAQGVLADLMSFTNASGQSSTFNPRGILDPDNPFFQDLGTNGRSCVTCHQPAQGWTITPAELRDRFDRTDGLDPIFRTNDGSNCEGADVSTVAQRRRAPSACC